MICEKTKWDLISKEINPRAVIFGPRNFDQNNKFNACREEK